MNKATIFILTIENVKKFVEKALMVKGDITLTSGKYTIDGKSIMGIMSLDLTKSFIVEYPEGNEEFDAFIQTLEV